MVEQIGIFRRSRWFKPVFCARRLEGRQGVGKGRTSARYNTVLYKVSVSLASESRTEFEINLLNNAVADIQGEILDRHVAHQQYYHHLEHKYQNISFAQKYLTPRSYSGILFLNIFDYLKEIVQERDC